jgi:hypothetical protein
MSKTLQERLAAYLMSRPNQKIAKGHLCDLARAKMGVTGETVGRRLRAFAEASDLTDEECEDKGIEHVQAKELMQGGQIKVEHRDKNHGWYWYEPPKTKTVRRIVIDGGVAREIIETINT